MKWNMQNKEAPRHVNKVQFDFFAYDTENGISTPHYYYVDNSDVPYGSYYTVIAHYADGTSKMTTPVKK